MQMFLDSTEIVELTGRKQKNAQIKALNGLGITHKERYDGSIVVLKEHVSRLFGGNIAAIAKKKNEPNWDMVNA